jgi:hypothetical protein
MFSGISKSLEDKGVFNTWMYQEQDLIQAFAKTYADRIICEGFLETINQDDVQKSSIGPVLHKVFLLHLLSTLERDLAWFMENRLLTPIQAEKVCAQKR